MLCGHEHRNRFSVWDLRDGGTLAMATHTMDMYGWWAYGVRGGRIVARIFWDESAQAFSPGVMPGDVKTGFTAAREKSRASDRYQTVVQKSVATMEHDEQNGMAPQTLAKAVLHLAQQKHPKPLSTCGVQYRLFAVLQKALPTRAVNAIVGKIYS